MLMARLRHLPRPSSAAGHRAARAVRPRRGREEAARHLLRRHEAPARPRDDARGRRAHRLPRRADHRPRPAQPPHHVGHRARASSRTASPSSSPRSTWTRPTSSPTGSRCSTTAGSSPSGTAAELKKLVPGGHVRLQFADEVALDRAADACLRRIDACRRRARSRSAERRRGRPRSAIGVRPSRPGRGRGASTSTSTRPTSTTCSSRSPGTAPAVGSRGDHDRGGRTR